MSLAAIVTQFGGIGGITGDNSLVISSTVSKTGTVAMLHGDGFDTGTSKLQTFLVLDGTAGRIELTGKGALQLKPGSRVTVTGTMLSGKLSVSSTQLVSEAEPMDLAAEAEPTASPTGPVGGLRVAVVVLNFSDMANTLTPDSMRAAMMTDSNSVARFVRDSSYGKAAIASVDVIGPVGLSLPASSCANPGTLYGASLATVPNPSAYDYFVYALPAHSSCYAGGWAWLNQPHTWVVDPTRVAPVVAHELGHAFGLHHASSLTCTNTQGVRASVSNTCSRGHEYGDYYDHMGFGRVLQFHNRRVLGWTLDTESRTVQSSGVHTLHPVHVERGAAGTVGTLVIPAPGSGILNDDTHDFGPCGAYAVEYRTTLPIDATAPQKIAPGVVVRRVNACGGLGFHSYIYDGSPWDSSLTGATQSFPLGHSFEDLQRQISIKPTSIGADAAVVQVTFGPDATAPSKPSRPVVLRSDASSADVRFEFDSADDRHVERYEIDAPGRATMVERRNINGEFYLSPVSFTLTRGQPAGVRIVAVDAAGNRSASSFAPIDTYPSAPTGVAATSAANQVTLRWGAGADDEPGLAYEVKRGDTIIGRTSATTLSELVDRSGWFQYSVRSVDSKGQTSAWDSTMINIDYLPPSNPSNLRVTNAWYSWIDLAWSASVDDVGVAAYRIHRESDNALLAQVTGTSWRHGSLPVNSGHTYYVRAIDAAGNLSGRTGALYAQTVRDNPPSTPTNFRVSDVGRTWIGLQWADSSDDRGVAGYRIYRASDGAQIGTSTSSWWRHEGLPSDQSRSYFVKAVDGSGFLSAKSVNVTGRTLK